MPPQYLFYAHRDWLLPLPSTACPVLSGEKQTLQFFKWAPRVSGEFVFRHPANGISKQVVWSEFSPEARWANLG